ncbi:MAG: DUF2797 domain-containing protein [Flavobacterium sp.]
MKYSGTLTKMPTELGHPIQYYLLLNGSFLHMNGLLQKTIHLKHTGYECLHCGSHKKIFRQGFCFDCFQSIPSAGDWIMKPELSKAHLDIEDRDLDYEKKIQLQPHVVYLAWSSELKVGVTRKSQIPTRWIDQGAVEAIPLVEVPNRYLAGIAEVALKNHFADKTNWMKMLQANEVLVDLEEIRNQAITWLPEEVIPFVETTVANKTHLDFPVLKYAEKVKSLNLEKSPEFTGKLTGIKGQYLLFEDGTVFNVRSSEGYMVEVVIG